ncbi:MAG: M1 family aminopeptidase [Bacteroidota bacterium]
MRSTFINQWIIVLVTLTVSSCQIFKPTANTSHSSDRTANILKKVADNTAEKDSSKQRPGEKPAWIAKKHHYNPERTRKNDLVHTRLSVSFDWGKQQLNGIATLTLKPHFYPQTQLELDAKGFDIRNILLVDDKTKKSIPLKYDYDQRTITIALDRTYTRDEKFTVQLEYTAKPNDLPKGGSDAITADKGLYFINPDGSEPNKPRQIWTQGETESSSCWFPTIDAPNQKSTQEMYITVDTVFTTLSNGLLEYSKNNTDGTRTDYWKMDKPHAPYLFMMAVGQFAIVKDKWKNMDVSYYVEPKFKKYARDIFGHTPEMIEFFSNKLGTPYAWDKYAQVVVRDYVSGAMENTTATVHMEALQVDDRTLLDESWDYIIAHELFHQWFGDLVTLESWANLPLNESFANYSEYLWNEYKYGVEEADYKAQDEVEQYLAEAENKQEPLIRYYYKEREDMFDSHSYAKGGLILHMLRKYVSDEAFFTSLKVYLAKHKFANVEIHDLRLAFEEVTGEDLNWFFNQWFLSAGHPQLKVEQNYSAGKVSLTINQLQDSLYTPIYRLPLQVDVWVGGQKTRYDVEVNQAVQTLEFPAATQPDLVIFDAEQQLVGTIEHEKSTPELVFQYKHAEKYLAKSAALTQLKKLMADASIRQIMMEAMNDKFWKIRELAVSSFDKYEGEPSTQLIDKLKSLALTDPRSFVRAEAIGTLAGLPGDKDYTAIYRKAMDDRSYTVAATALFIYLSTEPADAATQVARFENYDNAEVIQAVSSYYADQGGVLHYRWMEDKLITASGSLLYQLTQNFGMFLMKMDTETQKKGAQALAKIARQNQSFIIRFAAFQALSLIKDTEGVNELRKQIKAEETDPRLLSAYESMM